MITIYHATDREVRPLLKRILGKQAGRDAWRMRHRMAVIHGEESYTQVVILWSRRAATVVVDELRYE